MELSNFFNRFVIEPMRRGKESRDAALRRISSLPTLYEVASPIRPLMALENPIGEAQHNSQMRPGRRERTDRSRTLSTLVSVKEETERRASTENKVSERASIGEIVHGNHSLNIDAWRNRCFDVVLFPGVSTAPLEQEIQRLPISNGSATGLASQDNDPSRAKEAEDHGVMDRAVVFEEDNESDYTVLPPQIVLAGNGSDYHPALLLTYELSRKIQHAVRETAEIDRLERWFSKQQVAIVKHVSKIDEQLSLAEPKLHSVRRGSAGEIMACEQLIRVLQARKQAAIEYDSNAFDKMNQAYHRFYQIQRGANQILMKVLVECNLINAEPDNDYEIEDFDEIWAEELDLPQQSGSTVDVTSDEIDTPDKEEDISRGPYGVNYRESANGTRHKSSESVVPSPTERKPFKLDIFSTEEVETIDFRYTRAVKELQYAEEDFENRYDDEDRDYIRAFHLGESTETEEEFSLRHLEKNRQRTRRLIEAEERFKILNKEAIRAGLKLGDRGSVFTSEERDEDRSRLSEGEGPYLPEMIWPATKQWTDSLPTEMYDPHVEGSEREPDDWEVETVKIEDSCSIAAEGDEARKIRKWQDLCNEIREREQFDTVVEKGQRTLEDFGFVKS